MKYVVTETVVRVVEAKDPTAAINTRSEGVMTDYRVGAEPSKEAQATAAIEAICQAFLPIVQGFQDGVQALQSLATEEEGQDS